jgi:hypothetical protein
MDSVGDVESLPHASIPAARNNGPIFIATCIIRISS